MASRMEMVCSQCGRPIVRGDDYWCSDLTEDRLFCSDRCMREFILEDDDLVEKVLDDWMETNAELYEMETDDPYDMYGVDEKDFI